MLICTTAACKRFHNEITRTKNKHVALYWNQDIYLFYFILVCNQHSRQTRENNNIEKSEKTFTNLTSSNSRKSSLVSVRLSVSINLTNTGTPLKFPVLWRVDVHSVEYRSRLTILNLSAEWLAIFFQQNMTVKLLNSPNVKKWYFQASKMTSPNGPNSQIFCCLFSPHYLFSSHIFFFPLFFNPLFSKARILIYLKSRGSAL